MSDWRPGAELRAMRMRADLYARIRAFFHARNVLEVEVPLIGQTAASDPHINSIGADCADNSLYYLQSSPEYFMKRLLSAHGEAIYSLGKAFRREEAGGRHNPEFTMLEWYRPGFDEHVLMDEVECLIGGVLTLPSVQRVSYRALFLDKLGIDPHRAELKELKRKARAHTDIHWDDEDRDVWLDVLMTHCIEPSLGAGLVFVHDYPESQAALARVECDSTGTPVARRFEAYVGGVELANGYWELTDAEEQARRFEKDRSQRHRLGVAQVEADEKLLAAMRSGMPACAGVALGVDRLLMLMGAGDRIGDVLSFSFERL